MDGIEHLVFYDGSCPLCNRAVRFILASDTKKKFGFAPLDGKTAANELVELKVKHPESDTLVLLQNYGQEDEKTLIEGKAVLRILWLLGGKYALLGWLSFLPSLLLDAVYCAVAKNRYKLFKTKTPIETDKKRFLP